VSPRPVGPMDSTRIAGEPAVQRLSGPRTTGREYRNLSQAEHMMRREDSVKIMMRDGGHLFADVYRPEAEGISRS
jgi:uncharacterized protein